MIEILIVEDNKQKSDAVKQVLKENGVYGPSVTVVNNVRDALFSLSDNCFDILILDLNLPVRADSIAQPKNNSGITILTKLESEQYNTPDSIIGLTSFSDLKDEYEEKFSELAFTLFMFDLDDWKTAISNKVEWLKKSIRQKNAVNKREKNSVVSVLVHGVMTTGEWQDQLKEKLEELDHKVCVYDYNFFSALKIISTINREKQRKHFEQWFEKVLIDNPRANINIVAHSFGTYLVLKSLELLRLDNLSHIDNIVLLGSVMPKNYNFDHIEKKFSINQIVNECGTRDLPLIASKAFCIGLGHAGRVGFNSGSSILMNRFYEAGHSIFDSIPNYFEKYWYGYLKKEEPLQKLPRKKLTRLGELKECIFDSFSPLFSTLICILVLFFV